MVLSFEGKIQNEESIKRMILIDTAFVKNSIPQVFVGHIDNYQVTNNQVSYGDVCDKWIKTDHMQERFRGRPKLRWMRRESFWMMVLCDEIISVRGEDNLLLVASLLGRWWRIVPVVAQFATFDFSPSSLHRTSSADPSALNSPNPSTYGR